jgi:hypothetical protein
MNYYPIIIGICLLFLLVILADELAYKYWRVNNRGEHWSHLQYDNRPMTLVTWPWQEG